MRVLLIGGTGVLSSAVTAEALRQGIAITMINRGRNVKNLPDGVELIKSDRKNYSYIRQQLEGRSFDAVMDYLCYSDKDTAESVNLYKEFTKQYFFISSCAVYNTRLGEVCHEDSPKVLPVWSYSVNKWASEQHLMKLLEGSDVHYTIIRPCVTYGNTRIPYGISPIYGYHWTLAARILAGKPIIRWNGGINRCNITRVEDFAMGVVGLIGNTKAYDEAFNVCGDEAPSWNEVLSCISRIIKKEIKTIDLPSTFYAHEMPSRKGEILGGRSIDAIMDNSKLKSVIPDFQQTLFIEDGIRKTIEAYKMNNYEAGIDWFFDADTDRIISKWCKSKGIDTTNYHLNFIDYLGNATASDKIQYLFVKNKSNFFFFIIYKSFNLMKRIIRKLNGMLKLRKTQ